MYFAGGVVMVEGEQVLHVPAKTAVAKDTTVSILLLLLGFFHDASKLLVYILPV